MKRIIGICICLLLLVAAIAPTFIFASADSGNAGMTIHFLNPTAITYANGKLFVADNIDDNKSAVHCFDVSGNESNWLYTQSMSDKIVNISTKDDDSVYVVFANKIVEYAVSDAKLTESATITNYTNPVDVTYGVDGSGNNEYILNDTALYRKNIGGTVTTKDIADTKSVIAIGDYVYYLYSENGVDICKSYEGNNHSTPNGDTPQGYLNNSDPTSSNYFLKDFHAKGLFVWENEKVAIFNSEKICYIDMGATCSLVDIFDYQANQDQENKKQIVDVISSDNRLYILNDNFQVDIFAKSDSTFTLIDTVGDDTVHQDVPIEYTSFTLARPKGYPTNLIYKTTDDGTTVDEIIKNAQEYIILGFDGDSDSLYYYVLIGNKFGWVQKSREGATPTTDDNLVIVNTSLSNDTVDYKTKFNSLNAVYIHTLPREAFRGEVFTQTASTMPEVKLLQQFVEKTDNGEITWYYVSFEDGGTTRTGFVKKEHVGEFYLTVNENVKATRKKINSTLFEAVKVYAVNDKALMDDNHLAHTPDGNEIKLYSGQKVSVVSEENGVALIWVRYNDGTVATGYVMSDRLIGLHDITTNATVGLVVLAIAIALATALIVIFVRRKQGKPLFKFRKKEDKSDE